MATRTTCDRCGNDTKDPVRFWLGAFVEKDNAFAPVGPKAEGPVKVEWCRPCFDYLPTILRDAAHQSGKKAVPVNLLRQWLRNSAGETFTTTELANAFSVYMRPPSTGSFRMLVNRGEISSIRKGNKNHPGVYRNHLHSNGAAQEPVAELAGETGN